MKLNVQSAENGVVCAHIAGKITQSDVSPFTEPLAEAIGPDAYQSRVAISMADVIVLDSSGVSWLLVCHKRFREAGGKIVLHSLSDIALNVLKVLNLQFVFKLAANEEEAIRLLGEG